MCYNIKDGEYLRVKIVSAAVAFKINRDTDGSSNFISSTHQTRSNRLRVCESKNSIENYEKGISAELYAEKKLKSDGYSILGKRVRTSYGEIDILAKKDNDLIAVEVKQRRTLDIAKGCISMKQRSRISNSLMYMASELDESFENYRVDVLCLDSVGRCECIENAFSVADFISC
ncbi:MAG: YraN family protein [Holosporales bacterium]|jgi:putative endonuclease|nr:YraN family protein [Holosporales bacterium]